MKWKLLWMVLVIGATVMLGCIHKVPTMKVEKDDVALHVYYKDAVLFSYNYAPVAPPKGVDSVFTRSGFVHPVKTMAGHTLTRIHPEDHWHHLGIWNPWTRVEFRGDTLDFWNLNAQQGTIRFAGFEHIEELDDVVRFTVKHEHVVLLDNRNEVVLIEYQTYTIRPIDNTSYTIDFEFSYQPATEWPFNILKHRYAGFGWRATQAWNNQNSSVLTSTGETRATADGSLAEWVLVQGAFDQDSGGVVLMGNPKNENHPEPIRVWPVDMYDRGDVFVCMFPTKYADWKLLPGNKYTLQYRMVIFDGQKDANTAQSYWTNYFNKELK